MPNNWPPGSFRWAISLTLLAVSVGKGQAATAASCPRLARVSAAATEAAVAAAVASVFVVDGGAIQLS